MHPINMFRLDEELRFMMKAASIMSSVPITVVISVGPNESNKNWLMECIGSVFKQNVQPSEIFLIDDQAHLPSIPGIRIWKTPWLSGHAHAVNFGVGMAENDLVIFLNSDDKLLPGCIETCWEFWCQKKDEMGYYYMVMQYNNGETHNYLSTAAMIHKTFWYAIGGFPIEGAIGRPDNMLFQIMRQHNMGNQYLISDIPLYWYRQHPESLTNITSQRQMSAICKQVSQNVADNWEPHEKSILCYRP